MANAKAARMQTLIELGGNEWQKGDIHRIYLNDNILSKLTPHIMERDGNHHWIGTHRVTEGIRRELAGLGTRHGGKVWYDVQTGEIETKDVRGVIADALKDIIARVCEDAEFAADIFGTAEEAEKAAETPAEEAPKPAKAGSTVRTATGQGIQSRPTRTNKFGGYCVKCGGFVAAGKGLTYYIDPDEAYEHSGWVVEHKTCS